MHRHYEKTIDIMVHGFIQGDVCVCVCMCVCACVCVCGKRVQKSENAVRPCDYSDFYLVEYI